MMNNHITNTTTMADLLCFINMKHFKHHARNVMLCLHDLRIVAFYELAKRLGLGKKKKKIVDTLLISNYVH